MKLTRVIIKDTVPIRLGMLGSLFLALLTSGLELVCAQSPYNMRGFFISFAGTLLILSNAAFAIIGYYLSDKNCGKP